MNPSPHRISLARGWKGFRNQWERTFHSPTLPATVTQVRLIIGPSPSGDLQIQLNGKELTWSKSHSQLDCDITDRLQSINKLAVTTAAGSHSEPSVKSDPPFEAYLEIFDQA